jgi:hypothetical protein
MAYRSASRSGAASSAAATSPRGGCSLTVRGRLRARRRWRGGGDASGRSVPALPVALASNSSNLAAGMAIARAGGSVRLIKSMCVCLLLAALSACGEPRCPSNYEKRGDTCYRIRPDAGDLSKAADGGESSTVADADAEFDGEMRSDANGELDADAETNRERMHCEDLTCDDGGLEDESSHNPPMGAPELAVARVGAACERDQALACGGRASRTVLWCNAGRWEALDTCADDERCNPLRGETQGVCVAVPSLCMGKSPGEAACEGEKRVVCGADLLTFAPMSCDQGFTCRVIDGRAACVDIDECALMMHDCDTSPVAECVNTDGGFECNCPAGPFDTAGSENYRGLGFAGHGHGDDGCQDVDECRTLKNPCCSSHPECQNVIRGYFCCNEASCRLHERVCTGLDPWG